jgi:serine/threonine-protein kinase
MPAPQSSPAPTDQGSFASGRYVIRGKLGRGGMGEVYRAEDTKLKRPVAIKRLPPDLRADPDYRNKLLQEAERASSLNCPNIAGLYDVVDDGAEVCLVMEFVDGANLRRRLHEAMPVPAFLEVALQCTDALIAAHDRGIIHRDIKPENIMLTPSGRVKVLDFGLARQLPFAEKKVEADSSDSTITSVDMVSGTAGYMSPETLLSRPIDARTDLFSLGVVFYEALTGRHPFRDATFMATADRILHAEPPSIQTINPRVPPTLDAAIQRMIAKNASDRFATANEVRSALLNVQRQLESGEWRAPLFTSQRKKMLWAAVIAVGVVGVGFWAGPPAFDRLNVAQASALPAQMRVAVLPFRALSGDADNQAYSNGLTETLTSRLMQLSSARPVDVVPALEITTRNIRDVDAARKELGANLVLSGSVQRSGPEVRVNFALLDARTHKQLRAQTLTSTMQAGFVFEDQVAETVARMLQSELAPQQPRPADTKQNTQARELYLRAIGYAQDFDKPEQLERAVAAFNNAIAMDPDFSLAYAGLGNAYWLQYNNAHDSSVVERARSACGHAIALDGSLPEAHECLARVYHGTGQYESAITEAQRVLDQQPANEGASRLLAKSLEAVGKKREAEQVLLKNVKLHPNSWAAFNSLGGLYFRQARYDQAASAFQNATRVAPENARGYSNLAGVKIEQRAYAEAVPLLETSIRIDPSATGYANRGTAKIYLKDYDGAAADYEKAIAMGGDDWEVWGNLAEALFWSPTRHAEADHAYVTAIRLAQEAVRVNPRDAATRAELAKYHAMHGDRDAAQAEIQKSLSLAPGVAKTLFTAAVVEQQAGRPQRALDWLDKAVRAGYSPASVQDDPVFAPLRTDPGFQRITRNH